MLSTAAFTAGRAFLEDHGINLLAVLDLRTLAPELTAPLAAAGIDRAAFASLVLLGNGGRHFWRRLRDHGMRTDHPVDAYSEALARSFLSRYLGVGKWLQVYPGGIPLPLQQLGALAGWSFPSPLGLGIHPVFGTWFAYRGAYLVADALPPTPPETGESPCDRCADKPCVATCPVGAVRAETPFALNDCVEQRLGSGSRCETRCLARLACPAGVEHRYVEEQLDYHGRRSIESIRNYASKPSAAGAPGSAGDTDDAG